MVKGHNQLEGSPTGQIWDNSSIKINNDLKNYNPLNEIIIHKSKQI